MGVGVPCCTPDFPTKEYSSYYSTQETTNHVNNSVYWNILFASSTDLPNSTECLKTHRKESLEMGEAGNSGLSKSMTEKPKHRRRLLVGEGDFSYAIALVRKHPDLANSIVATDYAPPNPVKNESVDVLRSINVEVQHGVDAKIIHKIFPTKNRFKRIQWNFPFAVSGEPKIYDTVIQFFSSCAKIQGPGYQVRVSLVQTPLESRNLCNGIRWWERQMEAGIVVASASSSYRLIKKRVIDVNRYPGYMHKMSNGLEYQYKGDDCGREFTFEKVDPSPANLDIETITIEDAKALIGPNKQYDICYTGTNNDIYRGKLGNCYFVCDTDTDSSESDFSDSDCESESSFFQQENPVD